MSSTSIGTNDLKEQTNKNKEEKKEESTVRIAISQTIQVFKNKIDARQIKSVMTSDVPVHFTL